MKLSKLFNIFRNQSQLSKINFIRIGLIILMSFLMVFTVVRATPPSSPYNPGETLDPSCAPDDTNCTVGLTPGSVLFSGSNGLTSQDNSNLYWDNTNKRLGIGTATPGGKLDVFDNSINLFRVNNETTSNIEDSHGTVRYATRLYTPPVDGAYESTGLYGKIDPEGTNNQLFGIYGEITSSQEDGEGAFMKIIHYGHGDAVYVPMYGSGGASFESASFTDGTKGIISTVQTPDSQYSTLFNALWGQSTIPLYGMFYADQAPGNALTIRKYPNAPDNQTQIRIWENDLSRERFSVYNDGAVRLSSLTATSTSPLHNSPSLALRGAYWTGTGSADRDFYIKNVISTTTPEYHLSFQDNNLNERLVITNTGNVGIGTTNPEAKLDVNGNIMIPSTGRIIWDNGSGGEGSALYRDSGYNYLQSYDHNWTQFTIAAPNQSFDSDEEATLNLYRNYTTGQKEFLELYNWKYSGVGQYGIRLQKRGGGEYRNFVIDQSDGTTTTNILTITPDRNIGIGTKTPGYPLVVVGSNPTEELNGSTPALLFTTTQSPGQQWKIASAYNDPNSISLVDVTNGNAQRIVVGSSGNVGIGTTNPNQKLEIDGGIRLNTTADKPTCDATTRGTLWFTQGGTGVKDALEICAKDDSDAYGWRSIY